MGDEVLASHWKEHGVIDWTPIGAGECDANDETLIDVRFSSGSVLFRYYPWEIKWHGDNPGFGYVTGYREHGDARSIRYEAA